MAVTREICKRCHRENPLGFSMPDELWAEAVPPLYRESVLCIFCFDKAATARGVDWSDWPIEWWPVSGVAAGSPEFGPIGAAYESGLTVQEISVSFGLRVHRVYRILRELGVARRKGGRPRRTELTERERAMIALYENGKTLNEVGIAFGVTREWVRQILSKRGNGTRGRAASGEAARKTGHIRAAATDAKVRAAYSMGLHQKAIQQATGLSGTTIHASLARQGLRRNSRADTKTSKALRLFDEGLSAAQITAEAGFKSESSLRGSLLRKGRHFTDRAARADARGRA